ncbi:hypothetical protein CFH99_04480 [Nocardioides aromaticivorans]|uniref:SnoaL-like domain-containing protein n=1 Tax=Nocardioides aromaticivorans TaxID=200618 RepID=A0ABX7PGE0_9ACTN|nr:nuclear transport factor 2 family protein [Nocardioides aromaticivorans]QSR24871.1 hypothetical protein CFH99_04480 [Nocardioides aromaticivorans]
MTETQTRAEAFTQRIAQMIEAMTAHDLDALMDHYDDGLVFVDSASAQRFTKDGLRDFVDELWVEQPDFTVRMAASHALGNEFAVMLEASASMPRRVSGEAVQVSWVIPVIYTFDPSSLKVVREISFSDEEAYQQTLADLGVA